MVFTKNRPAILSKTLHQLTNIDIFAIVLDDSTNTETRQIVNNIAKKGNNIYYHGTHEQKELIQKITELGVDLDSFVIKPLGTNGWTLGYTRNYAIILAKAIGIERALFMDDDIIIKKVDIIKEMMKLLDNADFVGAKINGMPDDSVVGHIMRELSMKPYEFLSGGFLAFDLDSVSEYFLNYYNEDWIWLFLHKPKVKLTKYGEVHQLPFNPFENAVERALQQEFGEILVDGVREACECNNFSLLVDIKFWSKIIDNRVSYVKKLIASCKINNNKAGINVGNSLLRHLSKINRKKFMDVFVNYYAKKGIWINTIHSLKIMDNKTLNQTPER